MSLRIRYWLTEGAQPEREVSKAEYVAAERRGGFLNLHGLDDDPATPAFTAGHVSGRVEFVVSEERM